MGRQEGTDLSSENVTEPPAINSLPQDGCTLPELPNWTSNADMESWFPSDADHESFSEVNNIPDGPQANRNPNNNADSDVPFSDADHESVLGVNGVLYGGTYLLTSNADHESMQTIDPRVLQVGSATT
ncbi:hypothetical protein CPSG_10109 [Coccidioides posadasii str. Silveira]|uniref:Uncharacterized protein n=2 Tax=Coccidioides posadasii (strain RMSCC 757 / Silveira) TaxID=443226 RepID=E9DJW0_COCPS|nr:hypothetical protein CPSG_10109 [Coccidioides posadasii str. Silveira]